MAQALLICDYFVPRKDEGTGHVGEGCSTRKADGVAGVGVK